MLAFHSIDNKQKTIQLKQTNKEETPLAGNESNISLKHEADEDLLKPLWIASQITHRPCCVYCISFWVVIVMTVIDSFLFEWAPNDNRIYLIEDDPYTEDYDAVVLALEATENDEDDEPDEPQTVEQAWWTIFMMFESLDCKKISDSSDCWILTPDNMKTITSYEEMVTKSDTWLNKYCYVGTDTTTWECSYFSLAEDLADYFGIDDTDDWDGVTTEEIYDRTMELYGSSEYYAAIIESSFNADFVGTNQTNMYRSFLSSGNPIPTTNTYDPETGEGTKSSKYETGSDDYVKQTSTYNKEFAIDLWEEITVDHNAQLKDGNLRVVTLMFEAWIEYYYVLANEAAYFITYAMIAVLVWMTYHLQSCWLSCCGMMGIMFSFPFAFFIYRCIFQVTYFDTLATLIVFVLLGIGADDVFVFTDAWHQSVHFVKDPTNAEERMTFAYRRASKAMFVTQVTTFFAFLATMFSLLLPIRAFGIWSATIVACDYILVITLYPSVLMLHHKYVKKHEDKYLCCCCSSNCCCCRICQTASAASAAQKKSADVELAEQQKDGMKSNDKPTEADTTDGGNDEEAGGPPSLNRARSVEEQAFEYRLIEQWFGLNWTAIITKIKYYLLVLFAIIFAIAIWQASLLEAVDESENWFFEDHYMQSAVDLANDFTVSEEDGLIGVNVIWGIDKVDRSGTDQWDVEDYGKLVWDDSFDMSSPEAQQFLYDVCVDTSYSDISYSPQTSDCPMSVFKNYTEGLGEGFPWVYSNDTSSYDADTQKAEFAELMYEFSQVYVDADTYIYIVGDEDDGYEIRFFGMLIYTDVSWDSSATDSKERRDDWDDWIRDTFKNNDECPEGVCNPLQGSIMWAWLTAQDEFVRSAVQGIAIAMPIAFIVLIFSTHNWIVAIYATLDIIGVMACSLAIMRMNGWQFGISESISIVIIIGFSVDYVVHFANAYLECPGKTRTERLSFSLLTMGVSVGSGAVTTLLAGFFLLFPNLVFFYKMGVIILITILAAILWALLFFTSMLAAFGPENDTGKVPFDKLFAKFKKDKGANEEQKPQHISDKSLGTPMPTR